MNIAPSATYTRCGDFEETIFHCVRDCKFSRFIWQHLGFSDHSFFAAVCVRDWIKDGLNGANSILFAASLWWIWRHRNSMCLSDEAMPLNRLTWNIMTSVNEVKLCFHQQHPVAESVRHIRWNNNNFDCAILNVDGSCIGSPTRTSFGGLFRNNAGFYLLGFSGSLPSSADILEAKLSAIFHGLTLALDNGIEELVCYSNSLLSINLITGNSPKFHVHAVLIQDIKDKLSQLNCSLHHTLHEWNHCAYYFAKLGASSDAALRLHSSPPDDLRPSLRNDATETLFPRH
ncbi:uncharacterized protein [Medicago truncatula]|uniref:uncharacterized protein n=1 Tax=Medicago truncatula TaxID=3880 RepID=UPI000D2F3DE0|nr:uncharacterized protein LOC112420302 [Medicago truncatula]